jgi:hypothetical protein
MGFASGNTASGVKIQAFNAAGNADGYLAFEGFTKEYGRFSDDGTFRVKGAGTAGSTDAFQVAGTAPADAARIDSSGNLLVGSTSSSAIANKNIDVNGTGDAAFVLRVGGTSTAYLYSIASQAILGTVGSVPITFNPNGTERARIDSSGNLMVGVASTSFRFNAVVASGADRDIFAAQIFGASNGLTVKWNHSTTTTRVNIQNLPTSSAGLAAGDLYNDSGTLKVA